MIALSIAGSDPSAGAGIQADLKTFTAFGVYGLTVVSAITSQNTSKFSKVKEVSSEMVQSQLESVLSDFNIDVIKIGMVYSLSIIKAIYSKLKDVKIPIVLDPVFESTTGGILLQNEAFPLFKKLLVPLSFVITPNVPEAERLAGMKIRTPKDVRIAAAKIHHMGAENVVIKGGHLDDKNVTDYVLEKTKFYSFSGKRINRITHGGGCNFSASLAVSLAKGHSLKNAVKFTKEFSFKSIVNSQKIGRGIFVTKTGSSDKIEKELSDAISKFTNLKNISKYIPEVQTNFVFSRKNPESLNDVLGVSGRIVKVGDGAIVAGSLKYGSSKHVGSAVFEMTKKFPAIRSGINIKYDKEFIKRAILKKFSVSHYERSSEPTKTRTKEGNTISWGIKNAIKKSSKPTDLIFHKGDLGKEPMILIFGTSPNQVLGKLVKIVT
ncbi:MAG: bifunctional hydroxymethylpyrimidine kinase/phosphomethylpyrimidine kinase [Thaumarchaeota archaeon]|nr:bifunctional hydroxymethylpyrimidine kinase/phosphomethylpyrimidine kinase [Nitrososphaerota archaeon]MBI3641025.1 bifunctional hydroxymethylpyrimidine kinase/phosphomethylpyrimidine kinase [Nitrososphaerota archaeon]